MASRFSHPAGHFALAGPRLAHKKPWPLLAGVIPSNTVSQSRVFVETGRIAGFLPPFIRHSLEQTAEPDQTV